jgi:hypothetical protein
MRNHAVLAVDVGGSHVKVLISVADEERRRFASGSNLGPGEMVDGVKAITQGLVVRIRFGRRSVAGARRPNRGGAREPRSRLGRL